VTAISAGLVFRGSAGGALAYEVLLDHVDNAFKIGARRPQFGQLAQAPQDQILGPRFQHHIVWSYAPRVLQKAGELERVDRI